MLFGFLVLFGAGGFLVACKGNTPKSESEQKIGYYTCPMHPQIHEDHPGDCPICGMRLVPVYEEPQSSLSPASQPSPLKGEGGKSVRISSERQQLIGVKTAVVSRQSVVQSIHASGRTMPMGKPFSVEAALTADEIGRVKPGQGALVESSGQTPMKGLVREVSDTIDPVTRLGLARIEMNEKLPTETFFNITIFAPMENVLTIPTSAIIDTGTRQVAFVRQGDKNFEEREIRTSARTDDEAVVTDGLKEGETVVTQAAFLIDSESQLKAAVTGISHD